MNGGTEGSERKRSHPRGIIHCGHSDLLKRKCIVLVRAYHMRNGQVPDPMLLFSSHCLATRFAKAFNSSLLRENWSQHFRELFEFMYMSVSRRKQNKSLISENVVGT